MQGSPNSLTVKAANIMPGNKADKVVLITGGNYGIGLGITTHLASIGNEILLNLYFSYICIIILYLLS